jgi:hypothetical protein
MKYYRQTPNYSWNKEKLTQLCIIREENIKYKKIRNILHKSALSCRLRYFRINKISYRPKSGRP